MNMGADAKVFVGTLVIYTVLPAPHANILFTGDIDEPIGDRVELLNVYVVVVFPPFTVEFMLVIETFEPFIYIPVDIPTGAELGVTKYKVLPEI